MPDVMLPGHQCARCEHIWRPREGPRPIICPKCKSPYWDRERRK